MGGCGPLDLFYKNNCVGPELVKRGEGGYHQTESKVFAFRESQLTQGLLYGLLLLLRGT